MKVATRGYKRNEGTKTIIDENIVESIPFVKGNTLVENGLYLDNNEMDGVISLLIEPIPLSGFGGNYRVIVSFTKSDIAKLFWECFPEVQSLVQPFREMWE